MLQNSIKTRICPDGRLRNQLKGMRKIKTEFCDSEYARKTFRSFNTKFWFGSHKVVYSNIFEEAWSKFDSKFKNDILELYGLKFINDNALGVEIADIIFNDKILNKPSAHFTDDQKVAMAILSLLSVEGAYSFGDILIREDDIIIDAGANMGIFSIFATTQMVKHIYAFEPQKQSVEFIKKNIELNDLNKIVSVIPYGLSNITANLVLSHSNEGRSGASVVLKRNDDEDTESIHCVTLDSWVLENKIERIDFIKADIEGAERNMLIGAVNILKKFAPRLAICTYHLPDDPEVIENIILKANSDYVIYKTSHKLFAFVPNK